MLRNLLEYYDQPNLVASLHWFGSWFGLLRFKFLKWESSDTLSGHLGTNIWIPARNRVERCDHWWRTSQVEELDCHKAEENEANVFTSCWRVMRVEWFGKDLKKFYLYSWSIFILQAGTHSPLMVLRWSWIPLVSSESPWLFEDNTMYFFIGTNRI